ncbi:unnamed protein product [Rotaria sp. Silwood1]|nr:unnamed protein product [Rotaria sp. Silwood1]
MIRLVFLLFITTVLSSSVYRPVVLMHGIISAADDMDELAGWIRTSFPGIYVVSIEIGNGKDDSFLWPVEKQVEHFCKTVLDDENLRQGFNMLGYSQGSVIVRGALEKCSLPVHNLITLSGVHQGVFGMPYLQTLPVQFRELVTKFAYEDAIQNAISAANYWRDPDQLDRAVRTFFDLPLPRRLPKTCIAVEMSCAEVFFNRLIARKPWRDLNTELQTKSAFERRLSWVHLLAIGLGATIGAGIFVLSGQAAAQYSGPSIIISFVITGVIALLASFSYSELGAMMPSSGSVYTYTYAALGEYLAWFNGWNSILLYLFGILTVTVAWSKHVALFIDIVSDYNVTSMIAQAPVAWNEDAERFFVTGQAINLPAIAITIAITILLIIGIRPTAIVNLVLVVIKIIIILIFIFACCNYVNRRNYNPFFPPNIGSFSEYGVTGMLQACTYVFFAYVGFDSVTTVAQEAKLPSGSLPIAIIGSTIISLLLYIGICTVMVGLVPYRLLNSDSPLSEAIKATPYGLWLSILMNLGVIASLATVALTVMLSQTRIFYAMAHDGLLPPIFAKIHSQTTTPWVSILISGTFCAVFSGICPVDILGESTSISALITYIFAHITVIVMRYTHRDIPRTFEVPFGKWLIPIIGSLLCILLMKGITKPTGYRFLAWTVLGQIIYFSYGFWHSKRRKLMKSKYVSSTVELLPTVETVMGQYAQNESQGNLVFENNFESEA